jgi:hypothetical protein
MAKPRIADGATDPEWAVPFSECANVACKLSEWSPKVVVGLEA